MSALEEDVLPTPGGIGDFESDGNQSNLADLIIGNQLRAGRASAPALVVKGEPVSLSGLCSSCACVSAQAPAVAKPGRSRCNFDAGLPKLCGGIFGGGRGWSDCIARESSFGAPRHLVATQTDAPLGRRCLAGFRARIARFAQRIASSSSCRQYRRPGFRTGDMGSEPTHWRWNR